MTRCNNSLPQLLQDHFFVFALSTTSGRTAGILLLARRPRPFSESVAVPAFILLTWSSSPSSAGPEDRTDGRGPEEVGLIFRLEFVSVGRSFVRPLPVGRSSRHHDPLGMTEASFACCLVVRHSFVYSQRRRHHVFVVFSSS
jgi:hypothetical protein